MFRHAITVAAIAFAAVGVAPAVASAAPGSPAPTPLVLSAPKPLDLQPQSANGCTGSQVCINVIGSGLHVDAVSGDVNLSGSLKWCGRIEIRITKGGNTYNDKTSPSMCGTAGKSAVYSEQPNASYPDGSRVCVYARTSSGHNPGGPACETVES